MDTFSPKREIVPVKPLAERRKDLKVRILAQLKILEFRVDGLRMAFGDVPLLGTIEDTRRLLLDLHDVL